MPTAHEISKYGHSLEKERAYLKAIHSLQGRGIHP